MLELRVELMADLSLTMSIKCARCPLSPRFQFVRDDFGSSVTGVGEDVGGLFVREGRQQTDKVSL